MGGRRDECVHLKEPFLFLRPVAEIADFHGHSNDSLRVALHGSYTDRLCRPVPSRFRYAYLSVPIWLHC